MKNIKPDLHRFYFIVLLIYGCSTSPDHGKYARTEAVSYSIESYNYPREKQMLVYISNNAFLCGYDSVEQYINDKGIQAIRSPVAIDSSFIGDPINSMSSLSEEEKSLIRGSLILSIAIETTDGPGGSWNPMSGYITSSLKKTKIISSIYDMGSQRFEWSGRVQVRELLDCDNIKFHDLLTQLLDNIK
jgi:hypothetical protein